MSFMTEEEKEGDVVEFLPLYNDVSSASPKEKTPVLTSRTSADTVTYSVSAILKRHSMAYCKNLLSSRCEQKSTNLFIDFFYHDLVFQYDSRKAFKISIILIKCIVMFTC